MTNMTRLISTIFLCLIFHQAFCCMRPNSFQTKEKFCADLDTPNALDELGASVAARNLTEFCQFDSVGGAGNSLCEMDIDDGWIQNAGLGNQVAEFCNPGSPILRNEFQQREINIKVGISQDDKSSSTGQGTDKYRIKIVDPMCAIL